MKSKQSMVVGNNLDSTVHYVRPVGYYGGIQLHPKSLEFLRNVFSSYTFVEDCPLRLKGNLILHIYAEQDTYDTTTGDLDGYYDSLFFRLDIYDAVNKVKYSVFRKDQIYLTGVASNKYVSVRLFKDGSTCIFSHAGDLEVDVLGTSVEVSCP